MPVCTVHYYLYTAVLMPSLFRPTTPPREISFYCVSSTSIIPDHTSLNQLWTYIVTLTLTVVSPVIISINDVWVPWWTRTVKLLGIWNFAVYVAVKKDHQTVIIKSNLEICWKLNWALIWLQYIIMTAKWLLDKKKIKSKSLNDCVNIKK